MCWGYRVVLLACCWGSLLCSPIYSPKCRYVGILDSQMAPSNNCGRGRLDKSYAFLCSVSCSRVGCGRNNRQSHIEMAYIFGTPFNPAFDGLFIRILLSIRFSIHWRANLHCVSLAAFVSYSLMLLHVNILVVCCLCGRVSCAVYCCFPLGMCLSPSMSTAM